MRVIPVKHMHGLKFRLVDDALEHVNLAFSKNGEAIALFFMKTKIVNLVENE